MLPSMWLRKVDAVFVDLALTGQAEDLEAARIGEDRPVPAHERVQPAEAFDQLVAGTQVEVIGVGQDELCAGFVQIARLQRLDIGLGAHRRKGRHLDRPVGRGKGAEAGGAVGLVQVKVEVHRFPLNPDECVS
jgi:hypothetical protein